MAFFNHALLHIHSFIQLHTFTPGSCPAQPQSFSGALPELSRVNCLAQGHIDRRESVTHLLSLRQDYLSLRGLQLLSLGGVC